MRGIAIAAGLALVAVAAGPSSASASIAFRTESHAKAHAVHSLFVPRPLGLEEGDVMVATVVVGGPHIAISATGWTPLRTTTAGAGLQSFSFYRVAGSSEGFGYLFAAPSGRNDMAAGVSAYAGVDATNPVDTFSDAFGPSPSANSIPPLTTTAPGDVVVGSVALGSTATATPDAAVTVRYRTGTGNAGLTSGDYGQAAAGTTSAHPYTTSGPAGEKATQAIALRAAADPVVPPSDPPPVDPKPGAGGWRLADGTTLSPSLIASLPAIKPKKVVRVSARGTVPVAVACPRVAAAGCRGTVALTVLKRQPSVKAARRRKVVRRRHVTFHLSPGAHRTLRAPLKLKLLRRRARHGRAKVRLVVSVKTPVGNAVRRSTITVLARRTPHRSRHRRR